MTHIVDHNVSHDAGSVWVAVLCQGQRTSMFWLLLSCLTSSVLLLCLESSAVPHDKGPQVALRAARQTFHVKLPCPDFPGTLHWSRYSALALGLVMMHPPNPILTVAM